MEWQNLQYLGFSQNTPILVHSSPDTRKASESY